MKLKSEIRRFYTNLKLGAYVENAGGKNFSSGELEKMLSEIPNDNREKPLDEVITYELPDVSYFVVI